MRRSCFVVLLISLAIAAPREMPAQAQALTHVNVVNVETGTIERDRTVVLDRGVIVASGATGTTNIPRGARVRDFAGAYVIPGLWDMHAHVGSTGRSSLALYVANGVTGVRDMGSIRDSVRSWRDSILAGSLVGPRLLLAGPIIENTSWLDAVRTFARQIGDQSLIRDLAARIPINTPQSARGAVDSITALGADFLKIRNDPPRVALFAMLRHARERGVLVAGHWPSRITPAEASDSGYKSLEHGPLTIVNGQLTPTLDQMSSDERSALFARFARNGTAYTPTIVSLKGFRLTPDSIVSRILADSTGTVEPRRRYVDRRLVSRWKTDFELKLSETGTPPDWSGFQKSWLRDLREMADSGVLMLAGTDAGSPLVFLGFAVADELEALVKEGGLTPLQSLRSATLNVAKWMSAERTFGSVSPGRRADLLVLEGDPLSDIGNIRKIRAVVRDGRVYERSALDSMLRSVEIAARTSRVSADLPDTSYIALVNRAQGANDSQRWPRAAELWKQALAANEHVPEHWYALGRALYNGGQYRESIVPFERALELGAGRAYNAAWNIARAYAHSGEPEPAFRWLKWALDFGLRSRQAVREDPAFEKYRADPRFRALADSIDVSKLSRAEGRGHDLELMVAEVRRMHRDPNGTIKFASFERQVRELATRAGSLNDNEFAVEVMRALTLLGSGHTGTTPESVTAWGDRAVPLQFFYFAEGLYIIAADSAYADLVGGRVKRVGEHDIDRVLVKIDSLIGKDHVIGARANFGRFLRYPQVSNGLRLISNGDTLPLTVQSVAGTERHVTVPARPTGQGYARFYGKPNWVQAHVRAAGEIPLYLRDRHKMYWFTILPAERAAYFQFNRVRNDGDESLETFLQRMFEAADSARAERLVIDMRWNYGGNTALLGPLLRGVMARERFMKLGGLFVIVGRHTFSAAQNATTLLERYANPIIVGEPTGSSPNFVGEDNFFPLPYSKMAVSVSDLYWQASWPQDERIWIAPLLLALPTWDSYRKNVDPAMEQVKKYRR
ncbi:MAG: amidohydrolase family protein [Gemmatimonadaceae bacterium]